MQWFLAVILVAHVCFVHKIVVKSWQWIVSTFSKIFCYLMAKLEINFREWKMQRFNEYSDFHRHMPTRWAYTNDKMNAAETKLTSNIQAQCIYRSVTDKCETEFCIEFIDRGNAQSEWLQYERKRFNTFIVCGGNNRSRLKMRNNKIEKIDWVVSRVVAVINPHGIILELR